MGRPALADGKRITICVKVSDGDAELIDARCADRGQSRSAWLQSLIAAALLAATDGPPAARAQGQMPRPPGVTTSAGGGGGGATPCGELEVTMTRREPVKRTKDNAGQCPHRLPAGAFCKLCA